jgi:hypothetical protein
MIINNCEEDEKICVYCKENGYCCVIENCGDEDETR